MDKKKVREMKRKVEKMDNRVGDSRSRSFWDNRFCGSD